MKKILVFALGVILLTSCTKEPITPGSSPDSVEKQIANLVKKADPELFSQLFNDDASRLPIIDIRYLPGVFYIPSTGIDNATCLGTNSICMVIVTERKSESGITAISGETNEVYEPGAAKLIVNQDNPIVQEISSFKSSGSTGNVTVSFE